MRHPRPEPKRLETIQLPDDLIAFLLDVHAKIERNDPGAMTESDDLLQQDDFVYGGRNTADEDEWRFTYFPHENPPRSDDRSTKWELNFTRKQLDEVASGVLRSISLYTCTDPVCKCRFWDSEIRCFWCDWDR